MRRCLLILLLLTACQSQPKSAPLLPTPSVNTLSAHYTGSALSGPLFPATAPSTSPLQINVRWAALQQMPDAPSVSLGSQARLIVAGNSNLPLLGSPVLTANVRLIAKPFGDSVDHSPTVATIAKTTSLLPEQVTAVFDADAAQMKSSSIAVEFRISRGPTARGSRDVPLQLALSIAKLNDATSPLQHETVVFDRIAHDGAAAMQLLIPTTFKDSSASVLSLDFDIHPATTIDAAATTQIAADLKQSADQLAARPDVLPAGISQSAGISAALHGLRDEPQRRASLVFLADQTNAHLCQDFTLVAGSANLAALSQKVDDASKTSGTQSTESLGWILDRSTFELLVALADSPESGKLTPELASVLTRFAGEAARHTASLDEIAHGLSGEIDLQNRVIAQNLLFLSDMSPAARVRAFDWLNSRKLAPAGFDPLGNPHDRRLALDHAASQPTVQP